MIYKEDIIKKVKELLNQLEIPALFQDECLNKMFGHFYYDMQLNVDITDSGARFEVRERGVSIKSVYIKEENLIIYLIVREILLDYFKGVPIQEILDKISSGDGNDFEEYSQEQIDIWKLDLDCKEEKHIAKVYYYNDSGLHYKDAFTKAFSIDQDRLFIYDYESAKFRKYADMENTFIIPSISPYRGRGTELTAFASSQRQDTSRKKLVSNVNKSRLIERIVEEHKELEAGEEILKIISITNLVGRIRVDYLTEEGIRIGVADSIIIEKNIVGYNELLEYLRAFYKKTKGEENGTYKRFINTKTVSIIGIIIMIFGFTMSLKSENQLWAICTVIGGFMIFVGFDLSYKRRNLMGMNKKTNDMNVLKGSDESEKYQQEKVNNNSPKDINQIADFEVVINEIRLLIEHNIDDTDSVELKRQLISILRELDKMNDVRDKNVFYPNYPRIIVDSWNYNDELSKKLMDLLEIYKKL